MGGKHFADRWLVSQSGLLDGHGGGGQSCVAKVRGHMALLWARSGQLVGLAVGGFAVLGITSVCLLCGACSKGLARSWAGVRGKVGAACRALHRSPVCVRFAFSSVGSHSGLAGVVVCLRIPVPVVVALCARFASDVRWCSAVVAFVCQPHTRCSGPAAVEGTKACCFAWPKRVFILRRFLGAVKVKTICVFSCRVV